VLGPRHNQWKFRRERWCDAWRGSFDHVPISDGRCGIFVRILLRTCSWLASDLPRLLLLFKNLRSFVVI